MRLAHMFMAPPCWDLHGGLLRGPAPDWSACVHTPGHGSPGAPARWDPARGSPRIGPRTVLRPSRTSFHRTVLRPSRTSLHRSPGAPARWDPRAGFPSDPSPHRPASVAHGIPSHRPASVEHFIASESRGARALGSPRVVPLGSVPAQSCVRRARHSIAPSCIRRALHCIGVPGRPRAGIPARGSPRIRPRPGIPFFRRKGFCQGLVNVFVSFWCGEFNPPLCIGVPGRPRAGIPVRGSPRICPRTVLRPSRTSFHRTVLCPSRTALHRTVLRPSRVSLHRSPGAPAR